MDELAAELGVDPLELREKNWIKHEEFPFTTVAGLTYDSRQLRGGHRARRMELFGYDELRAEQQRAPRARATRSSSASASRPSPRCAASRRPGCSARSTTAPAAGSTRRSGCCPPARSRSSPARPPHGQGHETAWSQIVADRLGVPFEDVEVLHGDTQISPEGLDTYGSRSLVVGGDGAGQGRRQGDREGQADRRAPARGRRATTSSSPAGRFTRQGAPTRAWPSPEIALAAFAAHNLPDGVEPTLDADATFDPVNFSFPHGTHLCAMEVDTETGQVKIRKYVCVDDIGKIVNPLIVEGQVHGGLVQGIAQALWEEAVYDDAGTLVTGVVRRLPGADGGRPAVSFDTDRTEHPVDRPTRSAPRASARPAPSPRPRRWSTPSSTRVRHLGVNDIQMPCTPERVWRAIHEPTAATADDRRRPHFETAHTDRPKEGPVIPAQFDYLAPTTVEEALAALAEAGDDAKVIAGGQSLLPVLRLRLAAPDVVVDLGRIDALRGIRDDGDALVIGAMTTHHDVAARPAGRASTRCCSPRPPRPSPTRRSGTAAPSAARSRTPTRPVTCRRAGAGARREFVIAGPVGRRSGRRRRTSSSTSSRPRSAGRDPHRGPDPQAHRLGRALREVRPGRAASGRSWRSPRPSRSTAARSPRPGSALTNMGSTPLRARGVEEALVGAAGDRGRVRAAAEHAAEGTNPPSDLNGDADYRSHLATVLTRRAVAAAAGA